MGEALHCTSTMAHLRARDAWTHSSGAFAGQQVLLQQSSSFAQGGVGPAGMGSASASRSGFAAPVDMPMPGRSRFVGAGLADVDDAGRGAPSADAAGLTEELVSGFTDAVCGAGAVADAQAAARATIAIAQITEVVPFSLRDAVLFKRSSGANDGERLSA